MISDSEGDWMVPGMEVEVMVPFSTSNPVVNLDAEDLGRYVHPHRDRTDLMLMYFPMYRNGYGNQWWIEKKNLRFLREHQSPEPGEAEPPAAPASSTEEPAPRPAAPTPKPEHKAMPAQARQEYTGVAYKTPPSYEATASTPCKGPATWTTSRTKGTGESDSKQPAGRAPSGTCLALGGRRNLLPLRAQP